MAQGLGASFWGIISPVPRIDEVGSVPRMGTKGRATSSWARVAMEGFSEEVAFLWQPGG